MNQIQKSKQAVVDVFYLKKDDLLGNSNHVDIDTYISIEDGSFVKNALEQGGMNPYKLKQFALVESVKIDYDSVDEIPEKIFAKFNSDDNPLASASGQAKIRELGLSHTSMSMGDFIVINGRVIAIALDIGWDFIGHL